MTPKEYLTQAYRLNERIDAHVRELDELRRLSTSIQATNFDIRVAGTRDPDPPYVKLIHKIADMQEEINQEIDTLVDFKHEVWTAIGQVHGEDERLLLRYRYLENMTWEAIGIRLNASERTVRRIHSSALQKFTVPNDEWRALP